MLNHTFTVKPNEKGAKHTITCKVPDETEWVEYGWPVQFTMLSAGRVKVQTAIRNNWEVATGGHPEGKARNKALAEYATGLFKRGGRTSGPAPIPVLIVPADTTDEQLKAWAAANPGTKFRREVIEDEETKAEDN